MDRFYRCQSCGHIGSEAGHEDGHEDAPVCVVCRSFEIKACPAPPAGRPVPLRVLHSAESRALHWKKQAERLSALINRAASAGAMNANFVTEARLIQAGMD